MSQAILTEDLSKSYGPTRALDGVSLSVPRGQVFGLLGPNGAGKTTFVRLLSTLIRPTGGVLQIEAVDAVDPAAITDADARAAGYPDRAALMAELDRAGTLYRIALRWAGEDPRRALAEAAPDVRETEALRERLARIDARTPDGP